MTTNNESDQARIAAKGKMFVILDNGHVFRRKPECFDYAFCGELANPTEERKAALLEALRNANPGREFYQMSGYFRKAYYANYKQAKEIVKNF